MLFNTLDFAIFLPIVFVLYWYVVNKSIKAQNVLLVVASYVFYGWWDWRFLLLIFFSSLVDYSVGLALDKAEEKVKRRSLLAISLVVNLGMLGFFKYYGFFMENFVASFSLFGKNIQPNTLEIILPVGISFYTFQTLSYTIDVYKKKLEPAKDIVAFLAFVSFFPQLVAGPIERATNLLPQFFKKRKFDYTVAVDGLIQILWGLVKKVVIADNCADFANQIFNHSSDYSGSTLVLGAVLFAFQIYGDFSGYSDIAIGTSKLFGFNLMQNFATPYFARDIAEFWRRWHISLTTWFRDYVYIPLGGSENGKWGSLRNTFVVFLVSGFWHGPEWKYIVWGAVNALCFLPLQIFGWNRKNITVVAENSFFPSLREFGGMILTFTQVSLMWVFFRAKDVSSAFQYLKNIFSAHLLKVPEVFPLWMISMLVVFVGVEWIGRRDQFALQNFGTTWYKGLIIMMYYSFVFAIFWFSGGKQEFVYFQF